MERHEPHSPQLLWLEEVGVTSRLMLLSFPTASGLMLLACMPIATYQVNQHQCYC